MLLNSPDASLGNNSCHTILNWHCLFGFYEKNVDDNNSIKL